MPVRYARGKLAWGICQRCGLRDLLENLVLDGYYPNIRVHRECYDPKHPQDRLEPHMSDAQALWRPSPDTFTGVSPVLAALLVGPSVQLDWTHGEATNGPRVERYALRRALVTEGVIGEYTEIFSGAIVYDFIGGIVSEVLTRFDVTVLANTTYAYQVVALDGQNRGYASNVVQITTPA